MNANGRPAAAGRGLLGVDFVFVLSSFYLYSASFESLSPACGCWHVMNRLLFFFKITPKECYYYIIIQNAEDQ
ncbi:MAG: hypothetical protein IH620_07490 [Ignavibacterium sp.]|nr:hypothetical protein [Ignavibacterium sp.]